jgi:SCY1-like protein 1
MQGDGEASIRTNTCILIGRLAPSLSATTRKKMLIPAFTRAMRDPFAPCRVAGLVSLTATAEALDHAELAGRALPAVAPALIDKEKSVARLPYMLPAHCARRVVRDQAFKTMELFMKRLEAHAATMARIFPRPSFTSY